MEKKGITWDEAAIAEHDQERGQRMPIDEPETPFLYYNPETDSSEAPKLDLAALQAKLTVVQQTDFATKRAAHYENEWKAGKSDKGGPSEAPLAAPPQDTNVES